MNSLQRHYNREHKETDDADEVDPGIDYDEHVEPVLTKIEHAQICAATLQSSHYV